MDISWWNQSSVAGMGVTSKNHHPLISIGESYHPLHHKSIISKGGSVSQTHTRNQGYKTTSYTGIWLNIKTSPKSTGCLGLVPLCMPFWFDVSQTVTSDISQAWIPTPSGSQPLRCPLCHHVVKVLLFG